MSQHICIIMFIILNYFVMSNVSGDINFRLRLNLQTVKLVGFSGNNSVSPGARLPTHPKFKRQAWCKSKISSDEDTKPEC